MMQTANSAANEPARLLDKRALFRRVPVSAMTVYRWEQAGCFPRRMHIGGKCFWAEAEINEWIARNMAARETEAQK